MSRTMWLAISCLTGAVLLICLLGMMSQFEIAKSVPLPIIALVSGATCFLAYRQKGGGETVDFASMVEKPGLAPRKIERNAPSVQPEAMVNESVIVGVLVAIGSCDSGDGMEIKFMLHPWRVKGKEKSETTMYVSWPRKLSSRKYEKLLSDFEADDDRIIEMRVVDLVENVVGGDSEAKALEVVSKTAHDPELASIAIKKREPVDLELNGKLVRFSLDEEDDVFAADVDWNGSMVRLYLESNDSRQIASYLADANALLADAESWNRKLRETITSSDLLEKHQTLLRPEDKLDARSAILDRLRLEKIHLNDEHFLIFSSRMGDVFANKQILVTAHMETGPDETDLC